MKQAQAAKTKPNRCHISISPARLPFPIAIRVRQRSLFSLMSLAFDRMQEIRNLGIGVKKESKRKDKGQGERNTKGKEKETKNCRPFHSLPAKQRSAHKIRRVPKLCREDHHMLRCFLLAFPSGMLPWVGKGCVGMAPGAAASNAAKGRP
jgi:hypothetical protein